MHRHECVFYGVIILNKRAALKLMRKLLKTQGFPKADIGTWAAGRIYEYIILASSPWPVPL